MVKIGIIGNDLGAYASAAFLRRSLPKSEIIVFSQGLVETPSFSSPWIRNDRKGRLCVMKLAREILEMGEREFTASKINNSIGMISKGGTSIEKIPSFSSVVRNLHAICLEPVRGRKKIFSCDISVTDFLANRFGSSFASNFSDMICKSITGQTGETVSVHALFPRMANNVVIHRSVLLGPLWESLSGQSKPKGYYTNVMDHLWQKLMSGGKYITMLPRFDLSIFFERLEQHTKSSCRIVPSQVTSISHKSVQCHNGESHEIDLVVSSVRPDDLFRICNGESSMKNSVLKLSSFKNMLRNRYSFECKSFDPSLTSPVMIDKDSGNMIIVQSGLYDGASRDLLVVDILSDHQLDENAFSQYPILSGFASNTLIGFQSDIEEIPSCSLGSNQALFELNQWRKKFIQSEKMDLQFVGKWFYAPTGSVTDIVADADRLVSLISTRYARYPKIENELTSDFVSRSDRSLDMKYVSESWDSRSLL
jgi:hypothetical protein